MLQTGIGYPQSLTTHVIEQAQTSEIVKKQLENKIALLKEEEKILESDIQKLEDPSYVARYAREKYLYSKDGEIIIRMPDDDE